MKRQIIHIFIFGACLALTFSIGLLALDSATTLYNRYNPTNLSQLPSTYDASNVDWSKVLEPRETWERKSSLEKFFSIHSLKAEIIIQLALFIAGFWVLLRKRKDFSKNIKHLAQRRRPVPRKRCEFCAEKIKKEAVVCKHCGRDLPKNY